MLTHEKFNSLPIEVQNKCYETLETCKRLNEIEKDTWKRIVNYYYDLENELPAGWFNYWE